MVVHTPSDPWSDDPISSSQDDHLGRGAFAQQTAALISDSHSAGRSIVYGLLGPWGSGKSSMINMIEEALVTSSPDWTVRRYTPWSASDADSVTAEFFRTLSHVLPDKTDSQVRHSVRQYARLATPFLKAIPIAGEAFSGVADRVVDALTEEKSWQDQFDELSKVLGGLHLSILIIVDDIDRLHTDELLGLFKTVRLLGRFPGIDYLLAYDEESVISVLTGSELVRDDWRALRYLEKIVQYPLTIPPVQAYHLDRIFRDGLSEIFGPSMQEWHQGDSTRLENCYLASFRDRLTTVRAVNRYLAQVRQYLPLLPDGEVNHVDYVILSYLRLHYPKLYEKLPRYKERLFGRGFIDSMWEKITNDERNTRVKAWTDSVLLDDIPREVIEGIESVLCSLFPALEPISVKGLEGFFSTEGSRRVCQDHYFDRYFALGLTADDVSDVAVLSAVKSIADGKPDDLWLREVLAQSLNSGSDRVLEKIRLTSSDESGAGAARLLGYCLGVIPYVPDDPVEFMRPRRRLLQIVAELATRTDEPGFETMQRLARSGLDARDVIRTIQLVRGQYSDSDEFSHQNLADLESAAGQYAVDALGDLLDRGDLEGDAAQVGFLYAAASVYCSDSSPQRRVWQSINGRIFSLEEIAAIWVVVDSDPDSGEVKIVRLNDRYVKEIAEFAGIQPSDNPVLDDFDDSDVSWENRVVYASIILWNWKNSLQST